MLGRLGSRLGSASRLDANAQRAALGIALGAGALPAAEAWGSAAKAPCTPSARMKLKGHPGHATLSLRIMMPWSNRALMTAQFPSCILPQLRFIGL